MLNELIFSWVTTAKGGAEESTIAIGEAIASTIEINVSIFFINLGPKDNFSEYKKSNFTFKIFDNIYDYKISVEKILSKNPQAILISNHRSFEIDYSIASINKNKIGIIFRGILIEEMSFRTFTLNEAFNYIIPSKLDWNKIDGFDYIFANSLTTLSSIRRYSNKTPILLYNVLKTNDNLPFGKNQRKNFLLCGRLEKWKNIEFGITSFLEFKHLNKTNINLNIVGDGSLMNELKEKFEVEVQRGDLIFHGWKTDLSPFLLCNELLIITSNYESFGRIIIEANAHGLPVFVPNSGAALELVFDGLNGIVYEKDNSFNFVQKLSQYLDLSEAKKVKMSEFSKKKVAFQFNPITIVLNLITQLINSKNE